MTSSASKPSSLRESDDSAAETQTMGLLGNLRYDQDLDDEEEWLMNARYHESIETRKGFLHELVALLKYGMPVSLATLCRLLTFATDASFIGSLGSTFFAAVAVAQMWHSLLLTSIYGTSVAINEVCSQATSHGEPGVLFLLGLLLVALLSVPTAIGFLHTDKVLGLIIGVCSEASPSQCALTPHGVPFDQSVPPSAGCLCSYAGEYSSAALWSVAPLGFLAALKQFFISQERVVPVTTVSTLALPVNYAINHALASGLFVVEGSLGVYGPAYACAATASLQLMVLTAIAVVLPSRDGVWGYGACCKARGFVALVARACWNALHIAIDEYPYHGVMLLLAVWGGASGEERVRNVGAQYALMMGCGVLWGAVSGVSLALQVRCGAYLLSSKVDEAFTTVKAGCLLLPVLTGTLGLASVKFARAAASLFTADAAVGDAVERASPWFGLAFASSGLVLALSAVLASMQKGHVARLVAGASGWGILLPMSWSLGFQPSTNLGGVWIAIVLGETFKWLTLSLLLVTADMSDASMLLRRLESQRPFHVRHDGLDRCVSPSMHGHAEHGFLEQGRVH